MQATCKNFLRLYLTSLIKDLAKEVSTFTKLRPRFWPPLQKFLIITPTCSLLAYVKSIFYSFCTIQGNIFYTKKPDLGNFEPTLSFALFLHCLYRSSTLKTHFKDRKRIISAFPP